MIKGEYRGASLGTLVLILVVLVLLATVWGLGDDGGEESPAPTVATSAVDV